MIVIIGLIIVVAAVVVGVAGVLGNAWQRACANPRVRGVRLSRDRVHRHAVPLRHRGGGGGHPWAQPASGRCAPHLPTRKRRAPGLSDRAARRPLSPRNATT